MHCHSHQSAKGGIGWKVPVLVLVATLGVVAFAALQRGTGGQVSTLPAAGGRIGVEPKTQDMGEVRMRDGLKTLTYTVKNTGSGLLTLTDMETSCMCTTAVLEVEGKTSPKFGMRAHGGNPRGWSQALQAGESGMLSVVFDPNAHGPSGVGDISRTITIRSNDDSSPVTQVGFTGTVVP